MNSIGRDDVRRLAAAGAQVVEVLPAEEYEEEHLPAAISLPLARIDSQSKDVLDASRDVIVYCWDSA